MASITGQGGKVYQNASNVQSFISLIREWKIDFTTDIYDSTSFAATPPTFKSRIAGLKEAKGSFSGNHGDANPALDIGDSVALLFHVDDNTVYYGNAKISSVNPTTSVGGEAMISYSFEFTGTVYILGADVVVDGDFTGDGSLWDVSDADVTYNTTTNRLDFSGDAQVDPIPNNVIDASTEYFTLITVWGYSDGKVNVQLGGVTLGADREADGTFMEIIESPAAGEILRINASGSADLSVSKIEVRKVL